LHAESYVHVHDARADSYGFSGVTQERRYVAGKLGTKLSAAA
jgi:4-oxalocrotonate tautomerase